MRTGKWQPHQSVPLWRFWCCFSFVFAPFRLWGCKNRASSICWPEIVKCMPNQCLVCFVYYGRFTFLSFVFWVCVVFCFVVFGCQYQCNRLPVKTRLQNDLLCVMWDIKPHSLCFIARWCLTFEALYEVSWLLSTVDECPVVELHTSSVVCSVW